jgi:hypothetical protein
MSNDRDDDESSSYIGSWTLKPGRFLEDLLSNSGSALWNPIKLCASEIDTSSRYASDPGLLFNARGGDGGSIWSSFWIISTNSDILSLVSAISHKETCKLSLQQPYFLWNWEIIRSARNNASYCTTLYGATGAIEKNARVIIHVSEPDRPPGGQKALKATWWHCCKRQGAIYCVQVRQPGLTTTWRIEDHMVLFISCFCCSVKFGSCQATVHDLAS